MHGTGALISLGDPTERPSTVTTWGQVRSCLLRTRKRAPQIVTTLAHAGTPTSASSLQNAETQAPVVYKPLSLGHFVIAA